MYSFMYSYIVLYDIVVGLHDAVEKNIKVVAAQLLYTGPEAYLRPAEKVEFAPQSEHEEVPAARA